MLFLILILSIIIILFLWKPTYIEPLEAHIRDIPLDEFNDIFNAELVHLPNNIVAIGNKDDRLYSYNFKTKHDVANLNIFINYWSKEINPNVYKKPYYFIFCFYDGYMERVEFCENPAYVSFEKTRFENKGEISEIPDCNIPILHKNKKVFVFSKKINDENSICIPDNYYIDNRGYKETHMKTIDEANILYDNRKNSCIYRGAINNGTVFNFFDISNKENLNQRAYFKKMYDEGKFHNIEYNTEYMSITSQLQYKYILDIDGYSNTWDATIWKLYSGSVLLKTDSLWKQWYYDKLSPWVHYVPIKNDFSDLNEKIQWCISNDEKCKEISKNARQFVVDNLDWEKVKGETIGIFNQYINSIV